MRKPIKVNRKFSGKYYIFGVVVEFKEDPEKEDTVFVEYPEQLVSYEQIVDFINRFYIAEAKPIKEEETETIKDSSEKEDTTIQNHETAQEPAAVDDLSQQTTDTDDTNSSVKDETATSDSSEEVATSSNKRRKTKKS